MEIIRDKDAMRAWTRARRAEGRSIGFVPTMGYLHEGHLSLVRAAKWHADVVAVSVYVNPTQFAPGEDFEVYPRDEEGDLARLEELGVDVAFVPETLYAPDRPHLTWVEVERLGDHLCGASRPTFFRGVTTVVSKLFHIVEPDVAVFGQKDYQQWRIIKRMVEDLDLAVRVVPMPIVREEDGLAMSSRNARLSAEERERARAVPESLDLAEDLVKTGERDADAVRARMEAIIDNAGGRVDYAELVDTDTLTPVQHIEGEVVVAVAAWFGDVRLIDNRELHV
ncbi:MAG: pantoate--beta-alanine ligase [Myxococcota bacterium]